MSEIPRGALQAFYIGKLLMAPNRNADLGSFSAHGIKSHEQSCLRQWDKKNSNKYLTALAVHVVEEELQRKMAHQEKWQNCRKQTTTSAALVPSGLALDNTESLPTQDQQPDNFTPHPWSEGGSDLVYTMSVSGDACQCSASDTSMGTAPIPNTLSSCPPDLLLHL
ncbi:hypothetical protein BD769DRAFT_1389779 [Suillus cothurnatus]|nr:hypothetical protein BD769DRAFT_1389779 [Suillus cothurnatus]